MPCRCVFVMGVSGCGKSTIGKRLADEQQAEFVDGDDYHSERNRLKLSNGIPLTDEDRLPWLQELANIAQKSAGSIVIACSALKLSYRRILTKGLDKPYVFLLLEVERSELERRLEARSGHFVNPSILESQLATLEVGSNEENFYILDAGKSVDLVVTDALKVLEVFENQ